MLSSHQMIFAIHQLHPELVHGQDFWVMHPLAEDGQTQAAEAEIVEWRSDQPSPAMTTLRTIFDKYRVQWQTIEAKRARDAALAACDWTQLTDVPEAIRQPWAAYRQALRDLPQQPGFPHPIRWPASPDTEGAERLLPADA